MLSKKVFEKSSNGIVGPNSIVPIDMLSMLEKTHTKNYAMCSVLP